MRTKKITTTLFLMITLGMPLYLHSQEWRYIAQRLRDPGRVFAFNTYNGLLYVGGGFSFAGNAETKGIAAFDSLNWYSLDGGTFWGGPLSLTIFQGNVTMGGQFAGTAHNQYESAYVASWDGTSWSAVGDQGYPNTSLDVVATYNNELYIGGYFSSIGNLSPNFYGVARWNGTTWNTLQNGLHWLGGAGNAFSMTTYNNELYVGGSYNQAGPVYTDNIARWNGTTWHAAGNGLNGMVSAMVVDTINNFLYAGGDFANPADPYGIPVMGKWDSYHWIYVGSSFAGSIKTLCFYKRQIFAGGSFYTSGDSTKTYNFIARWNGTEWLPLGSGLNLTPYAMQVYKDELYIGGEFTTAGGDSAYGLAKWFMPPDTSCLWLQPCVFSNADTVFLGQQGIAAVQFQNNNAYANTWHWSFGDTIKDPLHTFTGADTGTVMVQVTVTEEGCTKTASKNIVVLLGTNAIADCRLTNADLRIYPNPSTGSVTIEVTGALISHSGVRGNEGNGANELRITDQHGKQIKTISLKEPNSKTNINTKGWAKGTYLCYLVVGGKTVKVEKLVVE